MTLAAIVARVHCVLEQLGTDCSMEELVTLCPELTWNQMFIAIDYLSRSGHIRMMLAGDRTYRVRTHRAVTASLSTPAPL